MATQILGNIAYSTKTLPSTQYSIVIKSVQGIPLRAISSITYLEIAESPPHLPGANELMSRQTDLI